MATTMTLTDPERAAQAAATSKPGTPLEKPSRASSELDAPVAELEKNDGDIKSQGGEEEEEVEDMSKYPTGLPLAFIMTGLCLAVLLIALDQTIIATAIPKITGMSQT